MTVDARPSHETHSAAPADAGDAERVVDAVTCLGCGCACDDIRVVVRRARIVRTERTCPLGAAWFGDGVVPERTCVRGKSTSLEAAVAAAAELLVGAERPLVYVAPEVSCEAQRVAAGIADVLAAALDTASSSTVLAGLLAAQRRGRASATLGELRNRADVLVFWAVDPGVRYPRFAERYAPAPAGTHVPRGRAERTVIAVDVGADSALADADLRVALTPEQEVGALAVARAALAGRERAFAGAHDAWMGEALALAGRMARARYVGIVYDAEQRAASDRADGLIALAQALNGPTRCALVALRGGGNRSGADAVLTWQTGFPTTVDFARGTPRYSAQLGSRPAAAAIGERIELAGEGADEAAELASEETDGEVGATAPAAWSGGLAMQGGYDAVLLVGDPAAVPIPVARELAPVPCAAVGPRASDLAPAPEVAIDTGVPGIHESGVALRMDDVPLPLRPPLDGPRSAAAVLVALARVVGARRRRGWRGGV